MWTIKPAILNDKVHKFSFYEDKSRLTYDNVIRYWRESSGFMDFYFSTLRDSAFDAFFWENPPVTSSNIKQAYGFVLVDSPQLSTISADPSSFQDKFKSLSAGQQVIAFENLGRDAELIVPCPIAAQNSYAHFASFMRNAPEDQKHDLFMSMANSLNKRINDKPTWVSTSGLGVYWLHIRLDTRPKYYSYQAYRNFIEENSGG